MANPTFDISPSKLPIEAEPLTPEAFAPFGSVISPDHLRNDSSGNMAQANQGTAVKFIKVSDSQSHYGKAPSGKVPESTNWNLFRCSPPKHLTSQVESSGQMEYLSKVLERHPYSTQTFLPLGRSKQEQGFLVIVSLKDPKSKYLHLLQCSILITNNPFYSWLAGPQHGARVRRPGQPGRDLRRGDLARAHGRAELDPRLCRAHQRERRRRGGLQRNLHEPGHSHQIQVGSQGQALYCTDIKRLCKWQMKNKAAFVCFVTPRM